MTSAPQPACPPQPANPAAGRIPLLALHGFTGNGADFQWLAAQTADLFHWHTPDLPGHGVNAEVPTAAHTPAAIARAIDTTLQSIGNNLHTPNNAVTLSFTPNNAVILPFTPSGAASHAFTQNNTACLPFLLGYSMGGRMALRYLAQYGTAKVRGVILIGASAGLADAALRRARRRADHALATRIEAEGIPAFMRHWNSLPLIQSQSRSPYFAQLQHMRHTNSPQGLARSLRGIGTGAVAPLHARLPQIDIPCLLLTGEEDTKFTAIATELARNLPNARHIRIENAGHSPHWENPQAAVAAIRQIVGM